MIREFSFIGQELNGTNWVYGWPYKKDKDVYIHTEYGELVPIKPETLFQYTGCVDKNGRRIYENDRLRVRIWRNGRNSDPIEYFTHPKFEDGCFVIRGEDGKYDTFLCAYCCCTHPIVDIEVIRHSL